MENAEKEKKKNLSVRSVPPRRVIENSNKIAKKFKKLKNTIMAFFRVKTGWKRPRKREYKNYRSVSFQPDAKKFKKLKYTIMASFQAKIG